MKAINETTKAIQWISLFCLVTTLLPAQIHSEDCSTEGHNKRPDVIPSDCPIGDVEGCTKVETLNITRRHSNFFGGPNCYRYTQCGVPCTNNQVERIWYFWELEAIWEYDELSYDWTKDDPECDCPENPSICAENVENIALNILEEKVLGVHCEEPCWIDQPLV